MRNTRNNARHAFLRVRSHSRIRPLHYLFRNVHFVTFSRDRPGSLRSPGLIQTDENVRMIALHRAGSTLSTPVQFVAIARTIYRRCKSTNDTRTFNAAKRIFMHDRTERGRFISTPRIQRNKAITRKFVMNRPVMNSLVSGSTNGYGKNGINFTGSLRFRC